MCPILPKRNMLNVDKEKHVTRVPADVALAYRRDGNYVDVTWIRAIYVFFLVDVTHVTSRHIVPSSFEFNHGSAVGSPHAY